MSNSEFNFSAMADPDDRSGFNDIIDKFDWNETKSRIMSVTPSSVERVLAVADRNTRPLTPDEFMCLISPAAEPYLDIMAELSHRFTVARFGKTISLYIPMYVHNVCSNGCIYCGFNHTNDFRRTVLNKEQIEQECLAIKQLGPFDNLLIVSGEFPAIGNVDYFREVLCTARPHFHNLTLEVQPMKTSAYRALADEAGLDGVVCFQETYNRARYKVYHPRGMKSIYGWRLNGYDRMGRAGLHKIGMGVLLGLEDWRTDVTMMARHLRYLQQRYWQTRYSVNFPRLCSSESGFQPRVAVDERRLAQLTFAFRIFDHDVDISFSTRETPRFRDGMIPLGSTSMSAGSHTEPGGYTKASKALSQFDVTDSRTPRQVVEAIRRAGYEPVWKDWDAIFDRRGI